MTLRAVSSIGTSGGGIGLKSPGVLAQSAVAVPLTGTLAETTLATISVPAGAMGLNGMLRISAICSVTNNANAKTIKFVFGGTTYNQVALPSVGSGQWYTTIRNRNSTNSQVSGALPSMGAGTNSSAAFTGAVDTSIAQTLTITGTLANTGDTITLEAYTVELLNP